MGLATTFDARATVDSGDNRCVSVRAEGSRFEQCGDPPGEIKSQPIDAEEAGIFFLSNCTYGFRHRCGNQLLKIPC